MLDPGEVLRPGEILRARDRQPTPWRNGAGLATDVVAEPRGASVGDFEWRVSIATIDRDSDFSAYAGVDRFLMPLSVGGLVLDIDDESHSIDQFVTQAFAGEASVRAVEVTSKSLDLNLMVRRGTVTGSLMSERVHGRLVIESEGGTTIAIVLEGTFDGIEAHDAVVGPVTLVGTGIVAVARVRPV